MRAGAPTPPATPVVDASPLLDTDILSEILKRRDSKVLRRAVEYVPIYGAFTLSTVSVHEVVYGLRSKGADRQLREAYEAFAENEIVVPTLEDYENAGEVRVSARRRGRQLPLSDCLIVAAASRRGLPLATGNTAHLQTMIEEGLSLELEDWRDG